MMIRRWMELIKVCCYLNRRARSRHNLLFTETIPRCPLGTLRSCLCKLFLAVNKYYGCKQSLRFCSRKMFTHGYYAQKCGCCMRRCSRAADVTSSRVAPVYTRCFVVVVSGHLDPQTESRRSTFFRQPSKMFVRLIVSWYLSCIYLVYDSVENGWRNKIFILVRCHSDHHCDRLSFFLLYADVNIHRLLQRRAVGGLSSKVVILMVVIIKPLKEPSMVIPMVANVLRAHFNNWLCGCKPV